MYQKFQDIVAAAQQRSPKRVIAIAAAADEKMVHVAKTVTDMELCDGILVGDEDVLDVLLAEQGLRPEAVTIVDEKNSDRLGLRAVELVSSGKADILVKGKMNTSDFLRAVHCFICNQQEAGILFSENYDGLSPDEMLPIQRDKIRGAQIHRMVVTMGAQGAVFATLDGEDGYCPAKKVDVKDTTGAGDAVFAGAVIGLTYCNSMMDSCEIGTRLAASVITTGENVCPRYLPSEFGLDVSAPDDAQLALEL